MNENEKRMILNPNKDLVDKIIRRIYMNDGNCPCQPIEDGKDTRCPCFDFTVNHNCHCSLFVPEE